MIAIAYIFFFCIYLLVTASFAVLFASIAKKRSLAGWKFGLPVYLIMFGLIFWDWVPMEIMYYYKCKNEAGFFLNMTLNQWRKNNPGVWETLDREGLPEKYLVQVKYGDKKSERRFYKLPDGTELVARYDLGGKYVMTRIIEEDNTLRFWLNQRFVREINRIDGLFYIQKIRDRIVDLKTGYVLAEKIDFSTGIVPNSIWSKSVYDYKFWMKKSECSKTNQPEKWYVNGSTYFDLNGTISDLNGENR